MAFDFTAERPERVAATFFFGGAFGRLAVGFLARASDLEAADLDPFRANDFGEALFALGCFDLAFTARRLTDFWTDRPVELFRVCRLKPLVTGVLIRRSK